MCGMLIVPNTVMRSLAAGAILVGITSLAAALTLLPALLGLLGDRVNSLRLPFTRGAATESRFWNAIVRRVLRHPVAWLSVACAILLALAIPVLSLKIGTNGVSTLPDRLISKQGYLALQRDFPAATTDPVRIVVADRASDGDVQAALRRLRARLAAAPKFGPGVIRHPQGTDVAALDVPIRGDDASNASLAAVRHLRSTVIPETFAGTDARVLVGGRTAENVDYADSVI